MTTTTIWAFEGIESSSLQSTQRIQTDPTARTIKGTFNADTNFSRVSNYTITSEPKTLFDE
jgi:hypothetical protein